MDSNKKIIKACVSSLYQGCKCNGLNLRPASHNKVISSFSKTGNNIPMSPYINSLVTEPILVKNEKKCVFPTVHLFVTGSHPINI